jgi:hypothetical protein
MTTPPVVPVRLAGADWLGEGHNIAVEALSEIPNA